MGKRKRRAEPNKKSSTSDLLQNSSQMDSLSQQESSEVGPNAATPISSILELVDDSVKSPKSSRMTVHQPRFSRSMLLRNPSLFTRKYARRNTGGHTDASTSHAKVVPLHDEKVIVKTATRSRSDVPQQQTESLGRAIQTPASTRVTPFSTDAALHEIGKMCSICQKLLSKKPLSAGSSISPCEPSVLAVLVCGHVYHADCLEGRTCQEERMDPSCPMCRSLTSSGGCRGEIGQKLIV